MVYSASSFTLCPINESVLTQNNPNYSAKDLNFEVEIGFPAKLMSANILSIEAMIPTISHIKFVNFRILIFSNQIMSPFQEQNEYVQYLHRNFLKNS